MYTLTLIFWSVDLSNVATPAFRLHCKKCMGEIPSVTLTLITQIPMYYYVFTMNMIKAAGNASLG